MNRSKKKTSLIIGSQGCQCRGRCGFPVMMRKRQKKHAGDGSPCLPELVGGNKCDEGRKVPVEASDGANVGDHIEAHGMRFCQPSTAETLPLLECNEEQATSPMATDSAAGCDTMARSPAAAFNAAAFNAFNAATSDSPGASCDAATPGSPAAASKVATLGSPASKAVTLGSPGGSSPFALHAEGRQDDWDEECEELYKELEMAIKCAKSEGADHTSLVRQDGRPISREGGDEPNSPDDGRKLYTPRASRSITAQDGRRRMHVGNEPDLGRAALQVPPAFGTSPQTLNASLHSGRMVSPASPDALSPEPRERRKVPKLGPLGHALAASGKGSGWYDSPQPTRRDPPVVSSRAPRPSKRKQVLPRVPHHDYWCRCTRCQELQGYVKVEDPLEGSIPDRLSTVPAEFHEFYEMRKPEIIYTGLSERNKETSRESRSMETSGAGGPNADNNKINRSVFSSLFTWGMGCVPDI
eukprot:GHVU01039255.1.p1 GENE.GHVU01039255.1~~GHVU01039255.1.p1  ORF type:complete len:469 (+),score=39.94 GHVU01039255.1:1102-2508(+)